MRVRWVRHEAGIKGVRDWYQTYLGKWGAWKTLTKITGYHQYVRSWHRAKAVDWVYRARLKSSGDIFVSTALKLRAVWKCTRPAERLSVPEDGLCFIWFFRWYYHTCWKFTGSLCMYTGVSVYNPVQSVIREVPFLFRNLANLHNIVSLRWLFMSVPCDNWFNKTLYGRRKSRCYHLAIYICSRA